MDELDQFLNEDNNFLILPVIGPSGSGKTRLATQWLHSNVNNDKEEWHAGLLETSNTTKLRKWEPQCNTLIIIDYIYRFDNAIELIVEKAEQCTEYKVRLILIDHVFPNKLRDIKGDSTLSAIASNRSTFEARKCFFNPTLYLEKVSNRINILRKIIVLVSGKKEGSASVSNALEILQGEDGNSAAAHPLFAILIGQAPLFRPVHPG